MRVNALAWLIAAMVVGSATNTEPAFAAEAAPQTIVLKAAHLFDGRSGKLDSPGLVVVQGKTIVGVGANAAVPADARVVELGDATLLPGYIDAHTHIAYDYNENWAQGFYEGMLRFPVEQSFHAARNARVTLEAGVTTVREVGAADFIDVGLRNAINEGVIPGPRMRASSPEVTATAGLGDERRRHMHRRPGRHWR